MRLIWTPTAPGATPYTPFVRLLMDEDGIIRRPMKKWRVPHWETLPQIVDRTLTIANFDEGLMGTPWHCYNDSAQGEDLHNTSLSTPKQQETHAKTTSYEQKLTSWLLLLGIEYPNETHQTKHNAI